MPRYDLHTLNINKKHRHIPHFCFWPQVAEFEQLRSSASSPNATQAPGGGSDSCDWLCIKGLGSHELLAGTREQHIAGSRLHGVFSFS